MCQQNTLINNYYSLTQRTEKARSRVRLSNGLTKPLLLKRRANFISEQYSKDLAMCASLSATFIHIPVQQLRHRLLRKAKRNHIHIHSLYVTLGEFELIRLHEHTFTVQPNAVRILFFSFYDFSKSHKIRALRAIGLAPGARGMPQNACSGKPAKQGFSEHAS